MEKITVDFVRWKGNKDVPISQETLTFVPRENEQVVLTVNNQIIKGKVTKVTHFVGDNIIQVRIHQYMDDKNKGKDKPKLKLIESETSVICMASARFKKNQGDFSRPESPGKV